MQTPKTHIKVERSIITTYRKHLWARFIRAVQTYDLIADGDHIAVALSGGKDSLLLAKLLQEYQRYGTNKIKLTFIMMDPGYPTSEKEKALKLFKDVGIDVFVHESNIFKVVLKKAPENPCYLCARMRRGFLYSFAKEHGCNKLALGHHFDDVIETTLLNVFYGAEFKTMIPKADAINFEGITLIRPMMFIKEHDILRFIHSHHIDAIDCACSIATKSLDSKRADMKDLIASMRKHHKDVDISIFRAAENVNLDHVLGYVVQDEKIDFNTLYAKKEAKQHGMDLYANDDTDD